MGGRGSAYDTLLNELDKINQKQNEDYSGGTPVNKKDFYTDEESELHDDYFNNLKKVDVSMRKSTDNVNKIGLTVQQEWAEVLAKEYKNFFGEAKQDIQFACENIKNPKTGGYTAWFNENGLMVRMVLDSKRINKPSVHREIITESVKSQWHSPIDIKNNANKYTVTHEMGHVIESLLFEKLRKNNSHDIRYLNDRWLAIKVREDVETICKNNYTKNGEDVIMNISDYSKKNSMEWFAETFANLYLSEKPVPVALALSEYLDSKEFE